MHLLVTPLSKTTSKFFLIFYLLNRVLILVNRVLNKKKYLTSHKCRYTFATSTR